MCFQTCSPWIFNSRSLCSDDVTLYQHRPHHCVFTVQTSHPRLLQHHHEDERPHAASLTAQRRGPHPGSWYKTHKHTDSFYFMASKCPNITPPPPPSVLSAGSVGDAESALFPDVYVSDDGGYSWILALRGPHHYAILDSGGLLVAVEHTNSPVNQIK